MPESPTNFALRALKRRLLSKSQLRSKLEQKGFDPIEIEKVISDLTKRNFLNDHRLIEDLAQTGITKNLGKSELKRKLEKSGFDSDLIDRTINETYKSTDELALAIDLLKKKSATLKKLPEPTAFRRASSLLQRRGFDEEIVRQAILKVLGIEME